MVLSTSQQVALAFSALLLMFVGLPRLFGGGTENSFDRRYSRKGKLKVRKRRNSQSVSAHQLLFMFFT